MSTPNDTEEVPTEEAQDAPEADQPETVVDPAELEELPEDETARLSTVRERNRELRMVREQNAQMQAELDNLRQQSMSDQEKALEEAYQRGRNEGADEYRGAYAESRLTAVAAGRLADPTDALRYLPADLVTVEATTEDITAAIDQLLEERPYLAGAAPTSNRTDAGVRGPGPKPVKEDTPDDWLRASIGTG